MTRNEALKVIREKGIRIPPDIENYNRDVFKEYYDFLMENLDKSHPVIPYPDSFYKKLFNK